MAVLTSTGITFSDSTSLNSKYGIVPQNSISLFYQTTSPTGWTKSITHNDKTLRVVSGDGGGSGGNSTFSSVFPTSLRTAAASAPMTGSTGNTTLNVDQLPSHTHDGDTQIGLAENPALYNPDGGFIGWSGGDVERTTGWVRSIQGSTGPTGGGGSHNHPWSSTASFSVSLDLRVKYIDIIICNFD